MKFLPVLALAVSAALPTFSQASIVTTNFAHGSGSTWTVDFTVTNNGDPAPLANFVVSFSETLFADLLVVASPAAWDSIVLQPDTGLPAAGVFDSLADPGFELLTGESASGFSVQFTFLGAGAPGALPFSAYDEEFNMTFAGTTTAAVAAVPEPNAALLALLGLGALGVAGWRRREPQEGSLA